MEAYKELYLAKNIDCLDLLTTRNFHLKDLKFKSLCKALNKLYKESQQDVLDQEKTYIILFRYLLSYDRMLSIDPDKKFVELRWGSEYGKVRGQYEEIKKSLELRYAKSVEKKEIPEQSVSVESKLHSAKTLQIFNNKFITCQELLSALEQKKHNILLVDARPDYDFSESRFGNGSTTCINVPDQRITSGLSAHVLGKMLPEATQKIWEKRDAFDVIVLYDWNTTSEDFPLTKLDKLRSALVDWDFNRNYKERPVIVNGGYLDILQTYPTYCLNPQVYLSRHDNELDELLDIDNIEYPTESDNRTHVMPPDSNTFLNQEFKENSKLASVDFTEESPVDKQEVISKLLHLEGEWKKTNELCNDESNSADLSRLEEEKENLLDKISNYETILDNLNKTQEDTSADDKIETTDEDEDLKILNTISEERVNQLKKARALKPKLSNIKSYSFDRRGSDKPIINRATKPGSRKHVVGMDDIGHGLVGLRNIRNTCYMNAAIQCFRNVPYIKNLFCRHFDNIEIRYPAALMYETANLIRQLWSKNMRSIEALDFYQKVCTLEPTYRLGNHEDCMEFFLFLLNHLSEDCSYDVKPPDVMTPKQKAWHSQFQGKNSAFIDSFYHEIRIRQNCMTCGQSTYKFEIESTFMLSVPDREFSLGELMKEYMADFVIPEYCCAKCKKPVNNHKEMCFEPEVMVIVLKRYRQSVSSGQVTIKKVDSPCYFQQDGFKLGNYHYKLNSIAMHSGDMNFGHYTAACLTPKGWYEFNDETVRPININSDQIKVKACAFFYTMVEAAPSSKWG